jgi:hypothetical protein
MENVKPLKNLSFVVHYEISPTLDDFKVYTQNAKEFLINIKADRQTYMQVLSRSRSICSLLFTWILCSWTAKEKEI